MWEIRINFESFAGLQRKIPNPPHAGGIVPVRLYLSHAAMKKPHALGHHLPLKIPSSFTPNRVNSHLVAHLRAEHGRPLHSLASREKPPNRVKQNTLLFTAHSFPIPGSSENPCASPLLGDYEAERVSFRWHPHETKRSKEASCDGRLVLDKWRRFDGITGWMGAFETAKATWLMQPSNKQSVLWLRSTLIMTHFTVLWAAVMGQTCDDLDCISTAVFSGLPIGQMQ